MLMSRLTVTLDDEATQELNTLRVSEWTGVLRHAMETLPADESTWVVHLYRSLKELGGEPSSAAVVRQALDVYLSLLRETRDVADRQAGYLALAGDPERQDVVEVMSKLAPDRWSAEP
jgi:hypothetical protein